MSNTSDALPLSEYRHSAGFLLARLGARAERQWSHELRTAELTQTEFTVLGVLASGETMRQSEVADRAGIDPRNVVPTVAGLVGRGLVSSGLDPTDGRAKLLRLSDEGARRLGELGARLAPARAAFFAPISADEYETLCALLGRLYAPRGG